MAPLQFGPVRTIIRYLSCFLFGTDVDHTMTALARSSSLPLAILGLLYLLATSPSHAQERDNTVPRVSPNATVSQTIGVTDVKITYGRPSVRGRDIYGDLVPFDEVWRTGANEATTISFSTPVRVEGNTLDAGTYGFFTVPGPDQWTLIFNETAEQWGAYNYESSNDALRVQVEPESAPKREMMSFYVQNVTDSTATAFLHWNETRVSFEISANTPEILRTRAEEMMDEADDWRAPLRYVGYALENEVLLDDALTWVNRSIELEETFQNLRMKAYVLGSTGRHEQAVETANAALRQAEGMEESPNGMSELEDQLETWKSEM